MVFRRPNVLQGTRMFCKGLEPSNCTTILDWYNSPARYPLLHSVPLYNSSKTLLFIGQQTLHYKQHCLCFSQSCQSAVFYLLVHCHIYTTSSHYKTMVFFNVHLSTPPANVCCTAGVSYYMSVLVLGLRGDVHCH